MRPGSGTALPARANVFLTKARPLGEPLTDSEQRNLRTFRSVHPFWNAGDVDGVLAFYDDEIRWSNVALEEVYEGKAAVGEFLTKLFRAMPDLVFTADEEIVRGDSAAEKWTIRGTHRGALFGLPATGRPIEINGVSFLQMRDGKFVRDDFYFDTGSVLRQVGLMPSLAKTESRVGRAVLWVAVRSANLFRRRPARS